MAIRGQRFELDLDGDDFAFQPVTDDETLHQHPSFTIKEIQEHESNDIPSAPKLNPTKSGFPEHKPRRNISAFKQKQQNQTPTFDRKSISQVQPSDRAIVHHVAQKHGIDLEAQEKAEISLENKKRIAEMSAADIEEAKAELMKSLNPAFVERLLRRANIDEDQQDVVIESKPAPTSDISAKAIASPTRLNQQQVNELDDGNVDRKNDDDTQPRIHFPVPPRRAEDFVPLDPKSDTFIHDLRTHYFPDIPHDPSSLSWLQELTSEEDQDSSYNPEKASYSASSLRFGFNGRLIPPKESLEIDVQEGLHHHGEAPSSAGYTIPELAILCRSTLPNQRCIAYQIMGRILYRLGRGDFGSRGSELEEALWTVIEKERVIEVMMAEANRDNGHISSRAYATEALWLWRKGGGGNRGVLKAGEKIAK